MTNQLKKRKICDDYAVMSTAKKYESIIVVGKRMDDVFFRIYVFEQIGMSFHFWLFFTIILTILLGLLGKKIFRLIFEKQRIFCV